MDDSYLISVSPTIARRIKANVESLKLEASTPAQSDRRSLRGSDEIVLLQHDINYMTRMLAYYWWQRAQSVRTRGTWIYRTVEKLWWDSHSEE